MLLPANLAYITYSVINYVLNFRYISVRWMKFASIPVLKEAYIVQWIKDLLYSIMFYDSCSSSAPCRGP